MAHTQATTEAQPRQGKTVPPNAGVDPSVSKVRAAAVKVAPNSLTFINLFCGAGGLALGLERAGFHCVGAVEKNKEAAKTFKANFLSRVPDPRLLALGPRDGDVRRVDLTAWSRLLREIGISRLDLLVGGPPCQGFSRVGRGKLNDVKARGFARDPRNQLWAAFVDALKKLHPRLFLIENVPGMLHHNGCNVAEQICWVARKEGYQVKCAVLNSAAFGVPQIRERLFFIGVDREYEAELRLPTGNRRVELGRQHWGAINLSEDLFQDPDLFLGCLLPKRPTLPPIGAYAAIGDLPPFREHLRPGYRSRIRGQRVPYRPGRPSVYATLMRSWPGLESAPTTSLHICKANPRDYRTFASMKPGDRYPQALRIAERRYQQALQRWEHSLSGPRPRRKDMVPPYRDDVFPEKWRKLFAGAPSWTVTAHLAKDAYSHIHYDSSQARTITIREAARLQSFPDGYAFQGNIGDCFRQIGNAVPPLMAFRIGEALARMVRQLRRQDGRSAQSHNSQPTGALP